MAVVGRALAEPGRKRAPTGHEGEGEDLPLIGRSPAMQEIYRILARLTQTDLTVMITGESGTGKELVARVLHDFGKRRQGPFVAINMAAIPRELIESELFGHEKGAFTGAQTRTPGRFEQAEGGTLFLDEIGDMPLEAQTRLLRVLQQGEYTTVGGRTPIKTNVRIIAATHRDLKTQIQQGLFREDLFYRLNVVPMRLPPLRERIEDIGDLVRHFLRAAGREGLGQKSIETSAIERLKAHAWPGNVRELENVVRRLVALHPQDTLTHQIVEQELAGSEPPPQGGSGSDGADLDGSGRAVSDALLLVLQWRSAAAGPLRPRHSRRREAAAQRRACGDARQPDPRRRAARPQSQYAACADSRPQYPGAANGRRLRRPTPIPDLKAVPPDPIARLRLTCAFPRSTPHLSRKCHSLGAWLCPVLWLQRWR